MLNRIMNRCSSMNFHTSVLFLSLTIFICEFLHPFLSHAAQDTKPPRYVGAKACKPCHPHEYDGFIRYAKKSKSYESIERLKKGLSQDDLKKCYSCHTTGYGKPSGFISVEKTPELKNAGCEVCHGPGSNHVIDGDIKAIKRHVTHKDCEVCHTSERVRAFRYKPIIHGGGH